MPTDVQYVNEKMTEGDEACLITTDSSSTLKRCLTAMATWPVHGITRCKRVETLVKARRVINNQINEKYFLVAFHVSIRT